MGSVCNLLRGPASRVHVEQASSTSNNDSVVAFREPVAVPERIARQQESSVQRSQLDRLLRDPVPPSVNNKDTYGTLRERYATLRAFERRLDRLYAESLTKAGAAFSVIRALDEEHPHYSAEYGDNYRRALRESGMKPEDVAFMKFLETNDPPPEP